MTAAANKEKWKAYHQTSWARFDKGNTQHMLILSLCRQAHWIVPNEKYGHVVDLARLQGFLKSDKSPVKKPILKQTHEELSKTIHALEQIVKHTYSND